MNRVFMIVIPVILALAGAGMIWSLLARGHRSYRANAYSKSLVGHQAMVRFLQERGMEVSVNDFLPFPGSYSEERTGVAVMSPDPSFLSGESRHWSRLNDTFYRVMIVLPKWSYSPRPRKNPDWISDKSLLDRSILNKQLGRRRSIPKVRRLNDEKNVSAEISGVQETYSVCTDGLQVFPKSSKGVLVRFDSHPIAIWEGNDPERLWVSDPDVFSNGKLGNCENAAFVEAIFSRLFKENPVVVDEIHHGFRRRGDLLGLLFTFPGIVLSVNVMFLIICFYWAYWNRWDLAEEQTSSGESYQEDERRRSRLAQAKSIGQLTYSHGDHRQALKQYLENIFREISEVLGGGDSTDPMEIQALISKWRPELKSSFSDVIQPYRKLINDEALDQNYIDIARHAKRILKEVQDEFRQGA